MKFLSSLKARKLTRQIEKKPDSFTGYKELVALYMADSNYDDALVTIKQAYTQSWSVMEQKWLESQHLVIRRESGESPIRLLDDAFSTINSQDLTASFRIDTALAILPVLTSSVQDLEPDNIKKYLSSLQSLTEKLHHDSRSIQILQALSETACQLGYYADAVRYIEDAVNSAHITKDARFGRLCLSASRMAAKANAGSNKLKSWLVNALESDSLNNSEIVEVLAGIADINRSEDDLLGAMEKYETALRFTGDKQDCQTAVIRYQLARVNLDLERYPQAENEALNALRTDSFQGDEKAELLLWLASLRDLRGNISDAMGDLDTAFEITTDSALKIQILKKKAEFQEKSGLFSDAIISVEKALLIDDPRFSSELLYIQARLCNKDGEFHKALKLVKQIRQDSDAEQGVGKDRLLLESALAWLGRLKVVRAIETFIELFEVTLPESSVWQEAKSHIAALKKELARPDGVKRYQLDGSERKSLESLLAKLPDDDDLLTRLRAGLKKTRSGLIVGIEKILKGRTVIDDEALDEIEELMILSDLGVETTGIIIGGLREKLARRELNDADVVKNYIRSEIERILAGHSDSLAVSSTVKPYVIMVVGVNGVGKTTTIAKIAKRFTDQGHSVLMAAGDTFRAGAIEQLREWGKRLEVDVIAHREGADPSAVAWDAVAAAKNRNVDVLILDTAGRLHTKTNLMEELKKVQRVVDKNMPGAPHEILLVLDATTGQNAVIQARQFCQTVHVNGIVLTKLDGTAKGGIIVSIVQELSIPVKLIGIGERMDDLRDFDPSAFAKALFEADKTDTADSQT